MVANSDNNKKSNRKDLTDNYFRFGGVFDIICKNGGQSILYPIYHLSKTYIFRVNLRNLTYQILYYYNCIHYACYKFNLIEARSLKFLATK